MCLLSYFPPGVQPNPDELKCGATCNNDGHGFGILVPGQDDILTYKGMVAEDVIAEFVRLREQHPDGPALFHSRLTTHGDTNEFNCHPFVVNGDPRTVVGHNGILPKTSPGGRSVHPAGEFQTVSKSIMINGKMVPSTVRKWVDLDPRSDTHILADDILMREWSKLDRPRTRRRIEKWLTAGNKLVILTTDPAYRMGAYIFNESSGDWTEEGIWYSNDSYRGWGRKTLGQGSWYGSGAGSAAGWDDGWDDYYRPTSSYRKNSAGEWVPATSWEGDAEDSATWPTTLGGTRGQDGRTVALVTCDLCQASASTIPDIGLCMICWSCNDCREYISQCDCGGKARPHLASYRELEKALRFGSAEDVMDAWVVYWDRVQLFEGIGSSYGTDEHENNRSADQAGKALALTSKPHTPEEDLVAMANAVDEIIADLRESGQLTGEQMQLPINIGD